MQAASESDYLFLMVKVSNLGALSCT